MAIHGSYCNAVKHAYSETHFDEASFKRKKNNFWSARDNVREFFDNFAADANFEPLIAENWYNVYAHDITAAKVISFTLFVTLIFIFNNSFIEWTFGDFAIQPCLFEGYYGCLPGDRVGYTKFQTPVTKYEREK